MKFASRIRAVTFDAVGTLLYPSPSVGEIYSDVMARHGLILPPEALENAFRKQFAQVAKNRLMNNSEEREYAYWKAVVEAVVEELAPLPTNFDILFESLWLEFSLGNRWALNEDAKEVFGFLQEREIGFSLLTNWDRRVLKVLADHQILHRFEKVFISSEIGYDKPALGIFRHAERTLNRLPQEMLHVGDGLKDDVQGALGAGWNAVHLSGANASANEVPCLAQLRLLIELLE